MAGTGFFLSLQGRNGNLFRFCFFHSPAFLCRGSGVCSVAAREDDDEDEDKPLKGYTHTNVHKEAKKGLGRRK